MDSCIDALRGQNQKQIIDQLTDFNTKHCAVFTLNEPLSKRKALADSLFEYLSDDQPSASDDASSGALDHSSNLQQQLLQAVRILTREKSGLSEIFTEDRLDRLLQLAGLQGTTSEHRSACHENDIAITIEAQKCLYNLIMQDPTIQRSKQISQQCVSGLLQRLATQVPYRCISDQSPLVIEMHYFGMRLLFVLTALCPSIRQHVHKQQQTFYQLLDMLQPFVKPGQASKPIDDLSVNLCCEVLKTLFNFTMDVDNEEPDEAQKISFMRLTRLLRDLLLTPVKCANKQHELHNHIVNLLSNLPSDFFDGLLVSPSSLNPPSLEDENEAEEFESLAVLIQFLTQRLAVNYDNCRLEHEALSPILTCMCEMSRHNHTIRKYFRSKILPPLKNVMQRPEEEDTLRGRLVRLMTSLNISLKELVAEFLFVLCKENSSRLIKYTGYGNAAGLLASKLTKCKGDYSDDSENSDSDEYIQLRDRGLINPIIGCYEEPKPNPMDGMSDEQKEHEAMQLVEKIDKLSRSGMFKVSRIGDDGQPVPIESVLQLQESMLNTFNIKD